MEQSEIILRAIGVLTETQEMVRRLSKDAEPDIETEDAQLGRLVTEVFPSIEIPAESSVQEAAEATVAALMPVTISLVGAFAFLFSELAEVHDSGRTDIKTADLLQHLALRLSSSDDGDR
ncbi:hypothetical protein ACFC4G_35630 [Streptomyces sp. NPDC056002]|uniref:hypothetical protein n=1 Tax=unclassified Streptomyces TaxID=2593676 RepID=UPI0035D75DCC